MVPEQHITTREFLRNFRKYKKMLKDGTVHVVFIKIDDGQELRLAREQKGNASEIMERIRSLKKPIRIKRNPELMNSLIRNWPSSHDRRSR